MGNDGTVRIMTGGAVNGADQAAVKVVSVTALAETAVVRPDITGIVVAEVELCRMAGKVTGVTGLAAEGYKITVEISTVTAHTARRYRSPVAQCGVEGLVTPDQEALRMGLPVNGMTVKTAEAGRTAGKILAVTDLAGGQDRVPVARVAVEARITVDMPALRMTGKLAGIGIMAGRTVHRLDQSAVQVVAVTAAAEIIDISPVADGRMIDKHKAVRMAREVVVVTGKTAEAGKTAVQVVPVTDRALLHIGPGIQAAVEVR